MCLDSLAWRSRLPANSLIPGPVSPTIPLHTPALSNYSLPAKTPLTKSFLCDVMATDLTQSSLPTSSIACHMNNRIVRYRSPDTSAHLLPVGDWRGLPATCHLGHIWWEKTVLGFLAFQPLRPASSPHLHPPGPKFSSSNSPSPCQSSNGLPLAWDLTQLPCLVHTAPRMRGLPPCVFRSPISP